jgi:hypothetical protein
MKSNPRFNPPAFNPEKFLANEMKQANSRPVVPIAFSKERRKAFITRLGAESPALFYFGQDVEKGRAAFATLKSEITKELTSFGVADDARLVHFLLMDVMSDPAWSRKVQALKNA